MKKNNDHFYIPLFLIILLMSFFTAQAAKSAPDLWDIIRPELQMVQYNQHPKVRHFIHYYQKRPQIVYNIFHQGRYYLFDIVQAVKQSDLPMEIALIPFVESGFKPFNTSVANAQGIWQIRSPAGERFGINIKDPWINGLRDIRQSTRAALLYFKKLYDYFGKNWLYAIAAYNVGEGNFKKAIQNSVDRKKSTFYFDLDLPEQTQNYVPKLLAIAEIVRNPRKYHISLPSIPNEPLTQVVTLKKQMSIELIAQLSHIDADLIKMLNPGLRYMVTPAQKTYVLSLPTKNADLFSKNLEHFPEYQITAWRLYTIKPGERIGDIARKLKIPLGSLIYYNNLTRQKLIAGQNIIYPARANSP